MEKIVLDIQNIQKSFAISYAGRGRILKKEYKNVINGLSLQIPGGRASALIGGNGAGKTTLFNLISGLLRPDEGKIIFNATSSSIECNRATPWQISSAGVGRMFQGTKVFGELSVMDHLFLQAIPTEVELPFYNLIRWKKNKDTIKKTKQYIIDRLEQVKGFEELLLMKDKAASSLAFAQQRMLSLAGLMLGNYSLLLLDEPSSGMSPDSFDTIFEIIEKLKVEGKSVFLIEHNMSFIQNVVDHCHYMEEGKIRYSGSPDEVLAMEAVKQSYLM